MNKQAIISAIVSGIFTNEELNDVSRAIQFARGQLVSNVRRTIRAGANVQFQGRDGYTQNGTVTKVAVKFATVKVGNTNWKVPMNMLETV